MSWKRQAVGSPLHTRNAPETLYCVFVRNLTCQLPFLEFPPIDIQATATSPGVSYIPSPGEAANEEFAMDFNHEQLVRHDGLRLRVH